jgi:hypothetical protein
MITMRGLLTSSPIARYLYRRKIYSLSFATRSSESRPRRPSFTATRVFRLLILLPRDVASFPTRVIIALIHVHKSGRATSTDRLVRVTIPEGEEAPPIVADTIQVVAIVRDRATLAEEDITVMAAMDVMEEGIGLYVRFVTSWVIQHPAASRGSKPTT